jgi:glutamate racemase
LLATPPTVNRSYTDNLIRDFAAGCDVLRFGSVELVQWAEDWISFGREPTGLFEHLNSWLMQPQPVSHVVLGCTHFPLLRPMLERLWPTICWVDSGEAIARRVAQLVGEQEINEQPGKVMLFWTGERVPADGVQRYVAGLQAAV